MGIIRISANTYNTGITEPFARKKDLIKECPFGTSYNSYFIDDRKTALIGIVPTDFFDDFIYNLGLICDIGAIDYLIINKVYNTTANSIEKLLSISPNTTVVCTEWSKKLIDNSINRTYNCVVVSKGMKLKLGNSVIEFIPTPMLTSPDSMVTYFENDCTLFSGISFGSDFAEPKGTDEDILHISEYENEIENYFNTYIEPFSESVAKMLNDISGKTIYQIAPDNGIVITDNVDKLIKRYKSLCNKKATGAVILYASSYGYTKQMAESIYTALKEKCIKAEIFDMSNSTPQQCAYAVRNSKFVFAGSCTINKNLPPNVIRTLSEIDCNGNNNKKFLAFGSYGWSGEAVDMLAMKLQLCGMTQLAQPFKINMKPSESDLTKLSELSVKLLSTK